MEFQDIKSIEMEARGLSLQVDVKDISFCFLNHFYKNSELSYFVIFGKRDLDEAKKYYNSEAIQKLNKYILDEYINEDLNRKADEEEEKLFEEKLLKGEPTGNETKLSFEDNQKGMMELLSEVKRQKELGTIDMKDALKMETDLRVKFNDKFGANNNDNNNYVVVRQKFNSICPYCNHEILIDK